jgi:phosphate transport system substrate-binding protein
MHLLTLLFTILFSSSVYAAEITGAGATFPYPVYAKWADAWNRATGHKIGRAHV